jgi:hypothetical protein
MQQGDTGLDHSSCQHAATAVRQERWAHNDSDNSPVAGGRCSRAAGGSLMRSAVSDTAVTVAGIAKREEAAAQCDFTMPGSTCSTGLTYIRYTGKSIKDAKPAGSGFAASRYRAGERRGVTGETKGQ